MARDVMSDGEFSSTTFVVIDFETTTPVGHRPEPIDVAAVWLNVRSDRLVETGRFSALIRPPAHAPITLFDAQQTGITAQMTAGQPCADQVLSDLDARMADGNRLLVAHNAATESGILNDYRAHCPRLAAIHFLDTMRLARTVYPDLRSHGLDALIAHLKIPRPLDRHRAMPDVETTVQLFKRLIVDGNRRGLWGTLRQVRLTGSYEATAAQPRQESLFD
jgi:DNA polymerase III subunit epsilon